MGETKLTSKELTALYLAMHGKLDHFEKDFCRSCWKMQHKLSAKQYVVLRKILDKYFADV